MRDYDIERLVRPARGVLLVGEPAVRDIVAFPMHIGNAEDKGAVAIPSVCIGIMSADGTFTPMLAVHLRDADAFVGEVRRVMSELATGESRPVPGVAGVAQS